VRKRGCWKGIAVQRGLEPGSRQIDIVRGRYWANTSEDTMGRKRQRDFVKCGNSNSVIVIKKPSSIECDIWFIFSFTLTCFGLY
jgi:hypothetical protein